MAAFQRSWNFSNALLAASSLCKCGLTSSRSFYTLTKNGKKLTAALPNSILRVARYYEKPKEKTGPTAVSWAFIGGAFSGILIGAVAYFGKGAFVF